MQPEYKLLSSRMCCMCVCVCVCSRKRHQSGHPWVLLQATGHTFHTGHMPVCSEWLKQNSLSIDPRVPRGIQIIMHLPA